VKEPRFKDHTPPHRGAGLESSRPAPHPPPLTYIYPTKDQITQPTKGTARISNSRPSREKKHATAISSAPGLHHRKHHCSNTSAERRRHGSAPKIHPAKNRKLARIAGEKREDRERRGLPGLGECGRGIWERDARAAWARAGWWSGEGEGAAEIKREGFR